MELGLRGRRALVTGGSKGIGRAVAECLAAEGCALHLAARTAADLEAVGEALRRQHNAEVTLHAADLGQSGAAEDLARRCGALDILVNNAGAIPGGSLSQIDEATWRKAWDLKVFGYINLTRAVYAAMKERGAGVIVNIIGVAGERPSATYVAGGSGNAALMAFTRALGGASAEDGIRVLGVNPGFIATERLTQIADSFGVEAWDRFVAGLPFGRTGRSEEVADLVAFLVSDRASYINGTIVTIDGGMAARGL